MTVFDICFAWNWEYDAHLSVLLSTECTRRGLTMLEVTPGTLPSQIGKIKSGEISFKVLYDRASDSDPSFQELFTASSTFDSTCVNNPQLATLAQDKATMHLEFLSAGIQTPYTLILPPYAQAADLQPIDLQVLGDRFVIKPARGGGGEGVIPDAISWDEVISARKQFPNEKYLLQTQISPVDLDGIPAWFRVLVCRGAVYPCWWHPQMHIYSRLGAEDAAKFALVELRQIARRIEAVCRLDLFSTEIAMTGTGSFVSVDYVNDPVDLRAQSMVADGVPDDILEKIISRLVRLHSQ